MSLAKEIGKQVEDKKAKLAAIQKARAEREKRQTQAATTGARKDLPSFQSSDDILREVAALIPNEPVAPTPPEAKEPQRKPEESRPAPAPVSAQRPLTVTSLAPVEIFPVNVIKYNASIQVDLLRPEDAERYKLREQEMSKDAAQERARLQKQEDDLRTKLSEMEAEKRKLEEQKEEEEKKRKIMTPHERKEVMELDDFKEFFSRASLLVERALSISQDYDITKRYDKVDEKAEVKGQDLLSKRVVFNDSKRTLNSPVTSLSWSSKDPELLCASYAVFEDEDVSFPDGDGMVLIWNTHLESRPEYYFHCQSAVLTAQFHPGNPKLIIGGTRSGEVVMWDMREKNKQTPTARTTFSAGHTYPIFSLAALPAYRTYNIVSVSSDGQVCVWPEDNFHKPKDIILTPPFSEKSEKLDSISTMCFDCPDKDTTTIILGSDEGFIYKATTVDKGGITEYIPNAHGGPITAVSCHPTKNDRRGKSDLYLTSSYDWTVKLWNTKLKVPLLTLEGAHDYVYDVQWSPTHPSVFASGDGTGILSLWNLSESLEVPAYSIQIGEKYQGIDAAISRLQYSSNGRQLAVGTSSGVVSVYDVASKYVEPERDATERFYESMRKKMEEAQAAERNLAEKEKEKDKEPQI